MPDSITPPPELLALVSSGAEAEIAKKILQWAAPILRQQGADQELEACKQWLSLRGHAELAIKLGYCMRNKPQPPSLKEQALKALQFVDEKLDLPLHNHCNAIHTIRRALEALPND